jgi:polyferredoxin
LGYAKKPYVRSFGEKVFLPFFLLATIVGYISIKYPDVLSKFNIIQGPADLYFLGKEPSFWYMLIYTLIVCGISLNVLIKKKGVYGKGKKKLSRYQQWKFISIFLTQLIFFFIIPFIVPFLITDRPFFNDPVTQLNKDNYIYVSKGLTSWSAFAYIFLIVPLSVWLFGKRYCSWFCSCGNLAEVIGVTKWGAAWVKHKTPTGKMANKMEHLQTVFLIGGFIFGLILFLDITKIFASDNLIMAGRFYNDFVVDFIFGAIIGIGAYPFLGTRVWCRYGCPLAKGMELFGRHVTSKFKVVANQKCIGANLCSEACPMGIDVASYAHKNKVPLEGSFGLDKSPCVGCGGCIDICPVDALSFEPISLIKKKSKLS